MPELVVLNRDGRPETVAYQVLPTLLLNEMKKEHLRVGKQSVELKRAREMIRSQGEQLIAIKRQLSELSTLRAEVRELRRLTTQLASIRGSEGSGGEPTALLATLK